MFCFVLVLLKIFVSFGKKRKLIEILEFRFKKVRVLFGLKLSFEYFLKILFLLTLVRKGVIFKRLGVGVEFLKFFLKRKFIVVFKKFLIKEESLFKVKSLGRFFKVGGRLLRSLKGVKFFKVNKSFIILFKILG